MSLFRAMINLTQLVIMVSISVDRSETTPLIIRTCYNLDSGQNGDGPEVCGVLIFLNLQFFLYFVHWYESSLAMYADTGA